MKKTFSPNVSVICRDLSVKKFLVEYALKKGVPVYASTIHDTREGDGYYPNLTFSVNEICGTYSSLKDPLKTWISIDEFMEYCDNWENQSKEIKLTNDYNAQIDKVNKIVTVGCQKIPYYVIDELYEEMYK